MYNIGMRKIHLQGKIGNGYAAIIDDEDFDEISSYRWLMNTHGYALRYIKKGDGKWRPVFLHRQIAKTPEGLFTDHKNGNKLDNRKENLRITNRNGNEQNKGKRASWGGTPCSSQYIGVYYDKDPNTKRRKRWSAYVRVDNKRKYLGRFMTELEAAQVYDSAAKELHGEFAKVNF